MGERCLLPNHTGLYTHVKVTESGEPEALVEEELGAVIQESVSTVMTVVEVTDIVGQFEGRRIFLQGERTLDTHTVDIDAASRRVLQLDVTFVVPIGLDIGRTCAPGGVSVHVPVHTVVAQGSGGFVVTEIKARLDGQFVSPLFHVIQFGMEDILVKAQSRFTDRDGHQDVVPSDDIGHLSGFLHIVLACQLDMMP